METLVLIVLRQVFKRQGSQIQWNRESELGRLSGAIIKSTRDFVLHVRLELIARKYRRGNMIYRCMIPFPSSPLLHHNLTLTPSGHGEDSEDPLGVCPLPSRSRHEHGYLPVQMNRQPSRRGRPSVYSDHMVPTEISNPLTIIPPAADCVPQTFCYAYLQVAHDQTHLGSYVWGRTISQETFESGLPMGAMYPLHSLQIPAQTTGSLSIGFDRQEEAMVDPVLAFLASVTLLLIVVFIYVRFVYRCCYRHHPLDRLIFYGNLGERIIRGFRGYVMECYRDEMKSVFEMKVIELQAESRDKQKR